MAKHIYLEYRDEKSRKFWEAVVKGKTFTRRWGKVSTKGQTKSEVLDTPSAADSAAEEMVAEKIRKGYVLGHPEPQLNDRMVRAREIRKRLGGTDDLTLPFPPKPARTKWSKYWELYLEGRELERPLAGFLGKPKLWRTGERWVMTERPTVEVDGLDQLSEIEVPRVTRKILDQLDRLDQSDGVVFVEEPVDLATMLMMITHENANQIEEIRHRKWGPVNVSDLRRKRSKSLRQFKELFRIDVPDFVFELAHYIDTMWEIGPFWDCLADGFEETFYGIFSSVFNGQSSKLSDLKDLKFIFHDLNYFALTQHERVTWGVVFDYESNAFAPYFFYCDLEPEVSGSVWKGILLSMSKDDWLHFELGDVGAFLELNDLLLDELDHYELILWFFKLATVGYLNYHDKPALDMWGIDKIKYGSQIKLTTKSYLDGLKDSALSSAALRNNNFLPAYPLRLPENFHPSFTDESLSELLWACRSFGEENIDNFIGAAQEGDFDLLGVIGFSGKTNLKRAYSKKAFYRAIVEFCEKEVAAGRPYLAFFVALSIWSGSAEKEGRSLSAKLLEQVPDEICHPFLKLVARENISSTFD